MSRIGKIARLPKFIREQLKQRLDNNEGGQPLLDWLNALPQTREVVQVQFNGVPVSKQNLAQWRKGGFREQAIRDELFERAGALSDQADKMGETFKGGLLAGSLATVLAAQYARILATWDGLPNPKLEATLRILRHFCGDIALLQRTLHRANDHRVEVYDRMDADDEKEIKEWKKKALAPIMAILKEKAYRSMLGSDDFSRKVAAFIAAVDYDQPLQDFTTPKPPEQPTPDKPDPEKSGPGEVKPSQTNGTIMTGAARGNEESPGS